MDTKLKPYGNQIQTLDFQHAHIEEAKALALTAYNTERSHIPALPPIGSVPDLSTFADNGLGVAAFDNNRLVGFLCCYAPFDNAFGSTYAKGVFAPMGAHAAICEKRAKVYAAMYQAAGDKWVRAGAASHAVCLYAHDKEAQEQFFRYGFGLRCIDSIRPMEPIDCPICGGYEFMELTRNELMSVYPLFTALCEHQRGSPYFLNRKTDTPEQFVEHSEQERCFAAMHHGKPCAYLKITNRGETFDFESYRHINSAFCLPDHRGKGVYQNLINTAIIALKNEGFTRFGVDFESFNPAAYGFWPKYFTAYTHSVVRRIDEKTMEEY
ncbi:MAG: GNAT family N-acetyltransferase [Defluviitaleaceae bacterium]|nr:GNAT family N-acetyltransferase [Defluviitaleaceae bacterium]